jgi:hypothetical protein
LVAHNVFFHMGGTKTGCLKAQLLPKSCIARCLKQIKSWPERNDRFGRFSGDMPGRAPRRYYFTHVGKRGKRGETHYPAPHSPHRPTGTLTSLGNYMAAAPSRPPSPGGLPSKRKMSAQEVWVAHQLDLLAAGEVNLEDTPNRQSPVCSKPSATRAATMEVASEFTDLTGRLSWTAMPVS